MRKSEGMASSGNVFGSNYGKKRILCKLILRVSRNLRK